MLVDQHLQLVVLLPQLRLIVLSLIVCLLKQIALPRDRRLDVLSFPLELVQATNDQCRYVFQLFVILFKLFQDVTFFIVKLSVTVLSVVISVVASTVNGKDVNEVT